MDSNEEGNNIEYSAGDRTGTVLEITNEWGSQAQADAIYQKIRGFKYQPYRATGSQLDPSVEIGDAVTVKDTYGGVFRKTTSFGRYASTDIEAPSKEEVEHEFQIQSPTNRQYERFTRSVRASLSITAAKIAAEFFGTGRYENTADRNGYCTWSAWDAEGREWKFQKDVSIAGPDDKKCELVTPILHYSDI